MLVDGVVALDSYASRLLKYSVFMIQRCDCLAARNRVVVSEYVEKVAAKYCARKSLVPSSNAASLNYRDVIIPLGKYPFLAKDSVIPGSDGAGVVEAVGSDVARFRPGDRVVTLFHQGHLASSLDATSLATGLGGAIDGTLREYGVFDEHGLVPAPKNLNDLKASTLSCAALTAWNALYGLGSRAVKSSHWFLRKAPVAYLSSPFSSPRLQTPSWGEKAKELTGGVGVQHVVEVGGPANLAQSLKAIGIDGVIAIVGFLSGSSENQPTLMEATRSICTVRAVVVGSRLQMEDMIKAIEAANTHPVVDEKVFELENLKEAYQYLWDQKHFGAAI
ncbi:GroES-like protein [Pyrenochaeta sp. DS3sAY3a]|nr:GroES-like protein [Pyrenochaeta sp. DS3sAY3a]